MGSLGLHCNQFVDGVDFVDNVLWNFVEYFKATETPHASVEFASQVFEFYAVVLVKRDALM